MYTDQAMNAQITVENCRSSTVSEEVLLQLLKLVTCVVEGECGSGSGAEESL